MSLLGVRPCLMTRVRDLCDGRPFAPQSRAWRLVGYARVSTRDQHPEAQVDALRAAGCEQVFTEHASGTLARRPALDEALRYQRVRAINHLSSITSEVVEAARETVCRRRLTQACNKRRINVPTSAADHTGVPLRRTAHTITFSRQPSRGRGQRDQRNPRSMRCVGSTVIVGGDESPWTREKTRLTPTRASSWTS